MVEAKEFILPSVLIVVGFVAFMATGSDVIFLDEVLPYVFSAPFFISGCLILAIRLGAVQSSSLSLSKGLMSTEQYLEYKEAEKAQTQQGIGLTIMLVSVIAAGAVFAIGAVTLLFLVAFSAFSSDSDGIESVFYFFWNLLKICFWTYVGSHVLIARPWQYLDQADGEKTEEKRLVQCPGCSASIRVPATYKGRAKCPSCGEEFKP